MKLFLLLLFYTSYTAAEVYIYVTRYTATSGIPNLPAFTAVSFLHEKQIHYYDSKDHTLLPRQEWAKRVFGDSYWDKTTQLRYSESIQLQNGLSSAMESFGQREGVHTFQRISGCVWDDDSDYSEGFDKYAYDGHCYLFLDMENRSFTALVPEAESVAQMWNQNQTQLEILQFYYTQECVAWLKSLFPKNHGGHHYYMNPLQQHYAIVLPTIQQYRFRFPPVLVCRVTDLSSRMVQMFWQKNKKEVDDPVSIGETLPNGDGTFQKTIYLALTPKELMKNRYTCVLKFLSISEETLITMSQDSAFKWSPETHFYSKAHRSKWGHNDDEDYDDEEYDDEEYDDW
ncbi:major histocompatibility complex class I-related gene protein-like [Hoplias malabaricus]|uniref:major histocompatibility complex class I-related gene protein-like n=1 Tax=Hoplias malabaricus TaxID=27720 RepID=UPI0034633F11